MGILDDYLSSHHGQLDMAIRVAVQLLRSDRPELRHWGQVLAYRLGVKYARSLEAFLLELERRAREGHK